MFGRRNEIVFGLGPLNRSVRIFTITPKISFDLDGQTLKGRQNQVELCVRNDRVLPLGQRRLGVGQNRRRRIFPVFRFGETRPEEGLLVVGRSADGRNTENRNLNRLGPVFLGSIFFVGRQIEVVLPRLARVGREEVARWKSQEVGELPLQGFDAPPVVLPFRNLGNLEQ